MSLQRPSFPTITSGEDLDGRTFGNGDGLPMAKWLQYSSKTFKTCKGRRVNHDVTNHGALHNHIILYIYSIYIHIRKLCMSPNVTKRHQSRIVEFPMLGWYRLGEREVARIRENGMQRGRGPSCVNPKITMRNCVGCLPQRGSSHHARPLA
jgi:hypothetical protein